MAVPGIKEFYSAAAKQQFLRDFNFRVLAVNTEALALTSDEIVYAIGSQLPSRNISNHSQKFMGLDINYAGSVTYPGSDSYKLSFIVDASGAMRQKLERTSRTLFNDQSSTGSYSVPGPENIITLGLIDPKLETMVSYNLCGAQFRNIGEMAFNYLEGSGDLVKCDCTLSFVYYTVSDGSSNIAV